MEKVLFYQGSEEEYAALGEKKSNAVYFCDTGVIYKGDKVFSSMQLINNALEKISYNSDTRVIELPYYNTHNQLDTLIIDLGKDLIIKTAYYDSTTKEIVLVFETMMSGDIEEKEIRVSVNDLVDTYIGASTNTVDIEMHDKAIAARVKVPTYFDEHYNHLNYLKEGDRGLYVDGESYTNEKVGDLFIKDVTYSSATQAMIQIQSSIDTVNSTVSKIREDVDKKAPLTRVITSTGKTLENDIQLSYLDIDGAAPVNSPIFEGAPQAPTLAKETDWTDIEKQDSIATVKYVQEAITYSKKWGGLKHKTWKQLKGGTI